MIQAAVIDGVYIRFEFFNDHMWSFPSSSPLFNLLIARYKGNIPSWLQYTMRSSTDFVVKHA